MCRLLAYKGVPIVIDQLIYAPKNSLIRQSFNAQEIEEPLNGDGFGLGWFTKELEPSPAVFVSISPAWSNRNLRSLAPRIKSDCVFAHVRAASFGDTSESNCHPFTYGRFLMMHNGSIEGFDRIKRHIRRGLSDEIYNWIRGQTDSEHFFALFLEEANQLPSTYSVDDLAGCVQKTISKVQKMKKDHGIEDATYLNTVISDGEVMIATRYLAQKESEKEPALTLYYSEGSRYVCEDGVCYMLKADEKEASVLIVSEKLTGTREDWRPVPENHMIKIDAKSKVSFEAIQTK